MDSGSKARSSDSISLDEMILRFLYVFGPLPEESIVKRALALQPNVPMTTAVKNTQRALRGLLSKGLCRIAQEEGQQVVSLAKPGRDSAAYGDERLDARRVAGKAELVEYPVERVPTGVPGLDAMLNGGIPSGSVVLLKGAPGTGKTILSAQFLYSGFRDFGQNGIFVSSEVTKARFLGQMESIGMNFRKLDATNFEFYDAAPIRLLSMGPFVQPDSLGKARLSFTNLCDEIERIATRLRARRLVIDTLTSFCVMYDSDVHRRLDLLTFFESLHGMQLTTIVTAEATQTEGQGTEPEEYLSDGVIDLDIRLSGKALVRCLSLRKMRSTAIDIQPRPCKIDKQGIEVFGRETTVL